MKQPDISFCVPVYNVSAFLEACLASILSQTSDIAAQIICVDDCSTDDSWEVLQAIAQNNSHMICMRNEHNRGVSFCRNRALEAAQGQYVWFVDPDDLLAPGVVKEFLDNARKARADIILGNYARVDEAYALSPADAAPDAPMTFSPVEEMESPGGHPVDAAGKGMWAIWAGLFRTAFLKENHLRFREDMIAQEDTLFYYEIEQAYPAVIKTDAVCYLYRQRSSSVMNRKSEERIERYYASMRIMLEVYLDYLHTEKYRDKALLTDKIHRSYENVCSCLAQCIDHRFVNENLKELKRLGYYPYPFRKANLKQGSSKLKAILDYLLPIEMCFWIAHFIYAAANKRRFK